MANNICRQKIHFLGSRRCTKKPHGKQTSRALEHRLLHLPAARKKNERILLGLSEMRPIDPQEIKGPKHLLLARNRLGLRAAPRTIVASAQPAC